MTSLTREERAELAAKKKAERLAAAKGEPAPAVSAPPSGLSILRKASSLGAPSTLVFGNNGTGKSTLVRSLVIGANLNPLWLPLNNASVLGEGVTADWSTINPSDWKEFIATVYRPAMAGEYNEFNALVIDGGNVLTAMAVSHQAPSGQAERSDWLIASNLLRDALVKLRDKFGSLYVVIDVVADKDGGRKIDLNPYTKNVIVPLFGNKFYTHVTKERGEGNKPTGRLLYTVQKNPALALEFTVGDVVTLDNE